MSIIEALQKSQEIMGDINIPAKYMEQIAIPLNAAQRYVAAVVEALDRNSQEDNETVDG